MAAAPARPLAGDDAAILILILIPAGRNTTAHYSTLLPARLLLLLRRPPRRPLCITHSTTSCYDARTATGDDHHALGRGGRCGRPPRSSCALVRGCFLPPPPLLLAAGGACLRGAWWCVGCHLAARSEMRLARCQWCVVGARAVRGSFFFLFCWCRPADSRRWCVGGGSGGGLLTISTS